MVTLVIPVESLLASDLREISFGGSETGSGSSGIIWKALALSGSSSFEKWLFKQESINIRKTLSRIRSSARLGSSSLDLP